MSTLQNGFFNWGTLGPATRPEVTIGIDFGTATTKVAFRQDGHATTTVVPPPGWDPSDGGPPLWPSLVWRDAGRWRLGLEPPAAASSTEVWRWLKMTLVGAAQRDTPSSGGKASATLATLLIAAMLRHAASAVTARLGRDVDLTANLGAPLGNFNDAGHAAEARLFELVLARAWWLAFVQRNVLIVDGCDVAAAARACAAADAAVPTVPPAATRSTFIVPEVHASVLGTVQDRTLPDGYVTVVDVGAGTTDVSLFIHRAAMQTLCYIATVVIPLAGRDLDERLATALGGVHLLERVRESKERPPIPARVRQIGRAKKVPLSLANDAASRATNGLADEIRMIYRKHWVRGMLGAGERSRGGVGAFMAQFRPATGVGRGPQSDSPQLHMILVGGGCLYPPFRQRLRRCPGADNYRGLHWTHPEVLPPPTLDVACDGNGQLALARHAGRFTVAHGLTTHIAKQPAFYPLISAAPFKPSQLRPIAEDGEPDSQPCR